MSSFNNNSTTIQFQSAYKKLLLNNINIIVPASANCIPQETLIISDANQVHSDENAVIISDDNNKKKDLLVEMKEKK